MRRTVTMAFATLASFAFVAVLALPADAGGPTGFADVKYRKAGGAFVGNGPEYPSCGGGPVAKVERGKNAVFDLKVKNKGSSSTVDVDIENLAEFTGNADLDTKFFYDGANVTADVEADNTFRIEDLAARKSSRIFTIKAKVLQSADPGFIFTAPFVDSVFFGNPDDCASLNIKVKS